MICQYVSTCSADTGSDLLYYILTFCISNSEAKTADKNRLVMFLRLVSYFCQILHRTATIILVVELSTFRHSIVACRLGFSDVGMFHGGFCKLAPTTTGTN
jgi:hypothetical protein